MNRDYYKLHLVLRALRSGAPLQAIRLAWRLVRSRLWYDRRHVYALQGCDMASVPSVDIRGLEVQCLSTLPQLEALDRELREYPGLLPDDPRRLHAQGGRFWVARIDGRLASLGASRHGGKVRQHYFFPLLCHCAMLSHFATVPQFRGQGLYPALLSRILRQLVGEGIELFVIDCSDWNLGSQRGIRQAGFRLLGSGTATRSGRLSWHPRIAPPAPPCPSDGSAAGPAEVLVVSSSRELS